MTVLTWAPLVYVIALAVAAVVYMAWPERDLPDTRGHHRRTQT